MKRALFLSAAILAIAVLAGPAQAQTCLDFDDFCDGLEIESDGAGNLSGLWVNTDCFGSSAPIFGANRPGEIPNACGANGNGGVTGNPFGDDFVFTIDNLDGTLDMNMGLPPTSCWIPDLSYTVISGACPFDVLLQAGVPSTQ